MLDGVERPKFYSHTGGDVRTGRLGRVCGGAVGGSGVLPTEDADVAKAGAAAICPPTAPPDLPAKAVAFEA